jgi:predicted Zn finger-like uncharacterized protein
MLIVCKTCASSYHIPREILGENGCRLRCVGCGEAWTVTPQTLEAENARIVEGRRVESETLEPPPDDLRHRSSRSARRSKTSRRPPEAPSRKPYSMKKAGAAFAALLILGGAMAAVAARSPIVRVVPNTARIFAALGLPVNLRGLALDNVRTNIFDSGDRKILIVEGAIVNLRDSTTESPNMRIALRGQDKRELYVWTAPAPKSELSAHEQVAFRTRLAAPPDGVTDVQVRFAAAGDKLSPMNEGL